MAEFNEAMIQAIVQQILQQMAPSGQGQAAPQEGNDYDGPLVDISDEEVKRQILVDNPLDPEALAQMRRKTPARIGVGRAGPRLKTRTLLALRADHAKARDAVFKDVNPEVLQSLNLFEVKTMCKDRNEHLTRPDLGRKFDPETLNELRSKCTPSPQVQIYLSDGLSSTAVDANARDILPALTDGLKGFGIQVGTPFFVKYGRVPAMDVIGETLDAQVVCVLLGERPGLATADSMSAYIAYRPKVGMPEANRTVVSNIHKGGIPPVEAGAHVAELIRTILEKKVSGVALQNLK